MVLFLTYTIILPCKIFKMLSWGLFFGTLISSFLALCNHDIQSQWSCERQSMHSPPCITNVGFTWSMKKYFLFYMRLSLFILLSNFCFPLFALSLSISNNHSSIFIFYFLCPVYRFVPLAVYTSLSFSCFTFVLVYLLLFILPHFIVTVLFSRKKSFLCRDFL